MNRNDAKKMAETVSVADLKQMFINAQNTIKDWEQVSIVNKGLSKGIAFNILSKCGVDENTHMMEKVNMLREFGEFLPGYEKPSRQNKVPYKVAHQPPEELDNSFFGF